MNRLRSNLTVANAIALIALFASLGGTVYAAGGFSGKEIRKGSIPADRLVPGSIGGAQIDEASLGQVPSAARADKAARAEQAERAESAGRAEEAQRAQTAAQAASADLADVASLVPRADVAATADDALTLAGLSASELEKPCGPSSIKGWVIFEPSPSGSRIAKSFNCKFGRGVSIEPVPEHSDEQDLKYLVTFGGLLDEVVLGIVTSTDVFNWASAKTRPRVNVTDSAMFEVVVGSTVREPRVPRGPFVLVVF
ncbi:MAG TPA: hypothetical protein VMS60_05090 [Solirubrobacterales bacterium]|nr:hypothetical protein [Solirubrobacterales bacterium]